MCVVLSFACLFAVYEISYGDESGKLTHEQVFSTINRQHEEFPEKVIKPILQELEKRPKLMTAMENNDLTMKTVHRTNSEIEVQPGGTSSESIKVKHAANSEFHITPRLSNPVPLPFQNSVRIGRSSRFVLSSREEDPQERLDESKIYISNLGSGLLLQNGVLTKRNTVYYYPSVDMVTNTRRLVSPRFFTRFDRIAVPPASTVQVFHVGKQEACLNVYYFVFISFTCFLTVLKTFIFDT